MQNDILDVKPGDPLPSLDDFPILNQNQAEKTFFATFHKDCGNNDRCESQVVVNAELMLPNTSSKFIKKKILFIWDKYLTLGFLLVNQYEIIMGQYSEIILNATGRNFNESAYECKLFVIHPNSLNYIGTVKFDDVSF